MDLGLQQQSVLVTGGASNIGRAIALTFAREGANVTIADLDGDQADRVAHLATEQGSGTARAVRTDVTDLGAVEAAFSTARDSYGPVQVLVNAVGWDQLMFFVDTTPQFWRKVIDINYIGVLNCTRTALADMLDGGGSIVSVSSDASRQGEPREAVYGGVKAAINSFMKTIAKENGRFGVRCNVVCPGVTLPPQDEEVSPNSMWADREAMFTPEQLEKVAKAMPLKKIGTPQDIANAVVFLASNQAAGHITGQVLSVSGGYSMAG